MKKYFSLVRLLSHAFYGPTPSCATAAALFLSAFFQFLFSVAKDPPPAAANTTIQLLENCSSYYSKRCIQSLPSPLMAVAFPSLYFFATCFHHYALSFKSNYSRISISFITFLHYHHLKQSFTVCTFANIFHYCRKSGGNHISLLGNTH